MKTETKKPAPDTALKAIGLGEKVRCLRDCFQSVMVNPRSGMAYETKRRALYADDVMTVTRVAGNLVTLKSDKVPKGIRVERSCLFVYFDRA